MNGLACNLSTSISTLAVTLQAAANPDSITTVNCSVGSLNSRHSAAYYSSSFTLPFILSFILKDECATPTQTENP
jgi:hypothetical protein